jgi:pimeloyl-ACP methyl ester carboxylesterase
MRDLQITLSGRRVLAYTEIGERDWPCLVFFHGAPISRLHLAYLEDRFLDTRLRIVSPDRPGYGRSSPQPGRSLADWADDVQALTDAIGVDRFLVSGHSSGGPYAVACAALLAERIVAGIVMGGVTDMGWPGAWEGYSAMESALMRVPDPAAAVAWCTETFGRDGERFHTVSDFEFGTPDNALFADRRAGPALTSAVAEAFRQGVVGYAHDVVVQGRPWPFDPGRIAAPMEVVHGELDRTVPLAHSRHTSALIPGSTLRVVPGHAHMTLVHELPAMASRMARAASGA